MFDTMNIVYGTRKLAVQYMHMYILDDKDKHTYITFVQTSHGTFKILQETNLIRNKNDT